MNTGSQESNDELISDVQEVLTKMSTDIYESISSLVKVKTEEAEEAVESDINELENVVNTIDNEQNEDVDEELDELESVLSQFEKNKETLCIAFYEDNNQTLSQIVKNYFYKN